MNRLKKYRFDNNISLRKMAKMIGVSYSTVFNFERDRVVEERTNYYINHRLDEIIKEEEKKDE